MASLFEKTKKFLGSSANNKDNVQIVGKTSGGYSIKPSGGYDASRVKLDKEEKKRIFLEDRKREYESQLKRQEKEYEKELAVAKEREKRRATFEIQKEKAKFEAEQKRTTQYGPESFELFGRKVVNPGRITSQIQASNQQREIQRLRAEAERARLQQQVRQYQPQQTQQVAYGQAPPQQPGYQGGFNSGLRLPNFNLELPNSGLYIGGQNPQPSYPQAQPQESYPVQAAYPQQVQRQLPQAYPLEPGLFRRYREKYGYRFKKLQPGEQPLPGESLFQRIRQGYGYSFIKAT